MENITMEVSAKFQLLNKKKKSRKSVIGPKKPQNPIAAAGSIPHIGSGYCSIDLPFCYCTSIFSISNGHLSNCFPQRYGVL